MCPMFQLLDILSKNKTLSNTVWLIYMLCKMSIGVFQTCLTITVESNLESLYSAILCRIQMQYYATTYWNFPTLWIYNFLCCHSLLLVWPLITDKSHIKKSLHGEHGGIGKTGRRCIHLITNLYSSPNISDTDVNCLMFGWLLYLFVVCMCCCVCSHHKNFWARLQLSSYFWIPSLFSATGNSSRWYLTVLSLLKKNIFKAMLLNGAEMSGNGKGWWFPCPVQSHLSAMYVNEIQNIASELQDIWLKMSYNEKPPSVILWWAVIIGYGSVSSWTALKAIAIRADINRFRTYKTTVHFSFAYLC